MSVRTISGGQNVELGGGPEGGGVDEAPLVCEEVCCALTPLATTKQQRQKLVMSVESRHQKFCNLSGKQTK